MDDQDCSNDLKQFVFYSFLKTIISLNDPFRSSLGLFFSERHTFSCTKNFVGSKTILISTSKPHINVFLSIGTGSHGPEQPHESHIRFVSLIQFWFNC